MGDVHVPDSDAREHLFDTRPIAVDFFAGVGGLSLGLELAGFAAGAHVEVEEVTGRYAEYNFPLAAHFTGDVRGDIRNLSARHLTQAMGRSEIALVAGGPPCQGFSQAGRSRADDPLNYLVLEMARVILELQPMAFLIENVPGIGRDRFWQLGRALEEMEAAYTINTEGIILAAPDFGVPQERKRVFFIGIRRDLRIDPPSIIDPTHHRPGRPASLFGLPETPTVGDAILDLPDCDEFPELIDSDQVAYDKPPHSAFAEAMRANDQLDGRRGYRVTADPNTCANLRRTQHGKELTARLAALPQGGVDKVSRIKKLDCNGLAPTIRAGTTKARGAWSAPRPCHPLVPRVITTRECARFQTFPDWFRFHPAKWHGNRQVGNAVPPLLALAVGDALLDCLGLGSKSSWDVPLIQRDESLVVDDIVNAASAGLSRKRVSHKVTGTNLAARRRYSARSEGRQQP